MSEKKSVMNFYSDNIIADFRFQIAGVTWSAIENLKSAIEWARLDSNQQPTPYEGAALPLSYRPQERRKTNNGKSRQVAFLSSVNGLPSALSGRRESDPRHQLGRLAHYHYATPAFLQICQTCQRGFGKFGNFVFLLFWSGRLDLNQRPHRPKRCALPTALRPGVVHSICELF